MSRLQGQGRGCMAREEGIRVCMRVSIYLDERALPADDDIRRHHASTTQGRIHPQRPHIRLVASHSEVRMKPTCKLCETRHWTYEAHGSGPEKVRELGESMLGYEKRIPVFPDPNPPETVTTVGSTSQSDEMIYVKTCNACNKPFSNRGDVCNACRQRAYRNRVSNRKESGNGYGNDNRDGGDSKPPVTD